jgi:hypothetical protein
LTNALAILREKLSLRRLPTMTTTEWGVAMGFPYVTGARTGLVRTLAISIKDASA